MGVSVLYKDPNLHVIIDIQDITAKKEKIFRYKICIYPEFGDIKEGNTLCNVIELLKPLDAKDFEYTHLDTLDGDVKIRNEDLDAIIPKGIDQALKIMNISIPWNERTDLIEKLLDKLKVLVEKQIIDRIFLLQRTEKVIDYGNALDVHFRGINIPARIEDNDFLDPRDFKKWIIQNFKTPIRLTESEYQQLLANWFAMAEKKIVIEDPLANTVIENFLTILQTSFIYDSWQDEAVERLVVSGHGSYTLIVEDNKLWVHTKIISSLGKTEKTAIKVEKIREILKDLLIQDDAQKLLTLRKDGEVTRKHIRFWVFDWEKIKRYYPNLNEKVLISEERSGIDVASIRAEMNTSDINKLLDIIRSLWDTVQAKQIALSEELTDDIKWVLDPEKAKDLDNDEWLKEIIEKILNAITSG